MSCLCSGVEVHTDKEYLTPEVASFKRRADKAVSSIENNLRIVDSLLTGELAVHNSRGEVNLETTSVLIGSQITELHSVHQAAQAKLDSMGENPFCCHKCTEHRVTRVITCIVAPVAGVGGFVAVGAGLFPSNVDQFSFTAKVGILALVGAGLGSGRLEAYLEKRRAVEAINKAKLESLVDRTQRYIASAKMLLNMYRSVDYKLTPIASAQKLSVSASASSPPASPRAQAEHAALAAPAPNIQADDIPEEFRDQIDAKKFAANLTQLAVKYRSLPRGFSPSAAQAQPQVRTPHLDVQAQSALPSASEAGADSDGSVFVPLSSVELSVLPAAGQASALPHSPDAVVVTVAEHKQPDPQHAEARTQMVADFQRRNTPPAEPPATAQPSALSVAGAGQRLRKFLWG